MIVGIDVSRWQQSIDWDMLRKAGIEFAIIKYCQGDYFKDPKARDHYKGALSSGMVIGSYHWVDPSIKSSRQANTYKAMIDLYTPSFMCFDIEQYLRGTELISADRISGVSNDLMYNMQKAYPTNQFIVYTNMYFVLGYAYPMTGWMGRYGLWYAQYPFSKYPIIKTSWENLKSYYPNESKLTYPKGYPAHLRTWKFWQWSGDKFILPGIDTRVDLNYYNGTLEDLKTWTGGTCIPQPPAQSDNKFYEVTAKLGLNVRIGAGLSYSILRTLPYRTIVNIKTISDGWGYSKEHDGWMCMAWLKQV